MTITKPTPEFLTHLRNMSTEELLVFTRMLSTRYWNRLDELDIAEIDHFIQSDGCTGTFDFYRQCCVIHDWFYRTHRDFDGMQMTKSAADKRFRNCIMSKSIFGHLNPMAWWRYWVVRDWGRKAWQ